MAAPMVGHINEFIPGKEDWSSYQRRLEIWMKANKIKKEDRVDIFLATIGPIAFEVVLSLFAPRDIVDVRYDEVTHALSNYYKPIRNEIWERQVFSERRQKMEESVQDYILELKRLSKHCNFGATLDERLRDQLVGGVRKEAIQRKLLTEKSLTWGKACEISLSMELAEKDAKFFHATHSGQASEGRLNRIHNSSQPRGQTKRKMFKPCYRCGLENHRPDECYYKTKRCNRCKQIGHIERACKSNTQTQTGSLPRTGSHRQSGDQRPQTHQKTTYRKKYHTHYLDEERDDEEPNHLYSVNSLGEHKGQGEIKIPVTVEGKEITMILDTAASHSVIGEQVFNKYFSHLSLSHAQVKLMAYTNTPIPLKGEIQVQVEYDGRIYTLPLIVAEGQKVSLWGRNWISKINMNWGKIMSLSVPQSEYGNALKEEMKTQYPSVFNGEGIIKSFKADIQVKEGSQPKFCKARPVPYSLRDSVEAELDRLEKEGILKKIKKSTWASPVVIVPKADKRIRICGDYKVTVNPVLEENIYPLPTAEDLFAQMSGATVFTKLDLTSAYLQLELTEKSKELLVINTHKGLYEFQRLSFGISTAPAIFQAVMDQILQGIPRTAALLDDILIGTITEDEHSSVVHEVVKRLDTYGIKVNLNKCQFMEKSVQYLGHQIDGDGIHPLEDKIKAIQEAPCPTNVSQLRAFLGMVNYYGKFLSNMSTTLAPLYSLLKSDVPWKWDKEQETAFALCKNMLSSESVLIHYDPQKPVTLACDASSYGVGCVLSHVLNDGTERPIAYASRTLSSSERNYAQIEKEALSIVYGIKKFHKYLYGRKFTLLTDHKPLTTLFGPKTGIPTLAAARLQRWALLLMAHDYEIKYKKSADHANADGLSRLPSTDHPQTIESPINYFTQVHDLPVSADDIACASRKDPLLSRVIDYTLSGWPNHVTDENLTPYFRRRNELSVDGNCLLWGMRVVIPPTFQRYVLDELHKEHMGMVKMKSRARSLLWYPNLDHDIEMTVRSCDICQSLQRDPVAAPLHPWTYTQRVFERVHVDFAEFQGHNYFLLIDNRSKWIEVIHMTSTTAIKTIDALSEIFAAYGIPEELVSDNGPQFTAEIFKDFLHQNGVKHTLTPPYHPASNGAAERSVQIVKSALRKHMMSLQLGRDSKSAQRHLSNFLLAYRATPHSVTGRSPAELFLGRQVRTRLSFLKPNLQSKVKAAQFSQQKFHDKSYPLREFRVNEPCRVRNYRNVQGAKWIPARVIKRLGPVRYLVQIGTQTRYVHVDQMQHSIGHVDPYTDCSPEIDCSPVAHMPIGSAGTADNTASLEKCVKDGVPNQSTSAKDGTMEIPMPSCDPSSVVQQRRYPMRERKPVQRLTL